MRIPLHGAAIVSVINISRLTQKVSNKTVNEYMKAKAGGYAIFSKSMDYKDLARSQGNITTIFKLPCGLKERHEHAQCLSQDLDLGA